MPIPADTLVGTGVPFAKLVTIGDALVGAFAGGSQRQMRKYKTNELLFKADGKPLLQEVMHFVAMPGTTAVTGNVEEENTTPIVEGTHVRYAVSGFKWGQVIEARKALPAAFGFGAGQICSSDVYTITLAGFSAATDNEDGARKAGFTVEKGRILMRSRDEHEAWILNQSRKGASANAAKDVTVTIRRIDEVAEKAWMQQADELFAMKPWEASAESATSGESASFDPEEEPF